MPVIHQISFPCRAPDWNNLKKATHAELQFCGLPDWHWDFLYVWNGNSNQTINLTVQKHNYVGHTSLLLVVIVISYAFQQRVHVHSGFLELGSQPVNGQACNLTLASMFPANRLTAYARSSQLLSRDNEDILIDTLQNPSFANSPLTILAESQKSDSDYSTHWQTLIWASIY